MEFIVKRSEWLRGEGKQGGTSMLYRPRDGRKCCLGFFALACGYELEQIADIATLEDLVRRERVLLADMDLLVLQEDEVLADEDATCDAMRVNDNNQKSEADRERELTEIFATVGITVKFED